MELLEINTHFFLCFIINGVAATLWQLQLTIGKGGESPTGLENTYCVHIK